MAHDLGTTLRVVTGRDVPPPFAGAPEEPPFHRYIALRFLSCDSTFNICVVLRVRFRLYWAVFAVLLGIALLIFRK